MSRNRPERPGSDNPDQLMIADVIVRQEPDEEEDEEDDQDDNKTEDGDKDEDEGYSE
jgi:hypothetical protein